MAIMLLIQLLLQLRMVQKYLPGLIVWSKKFRWGLYLLCFKDHYWEIDNDGQSSRIITIVSYLGFWSSEYVDFLLEYLLKCVMSLCFLLYRKFKGAMHITCMLADLTMKLVTMWPELATGHAFVFTELVEHFPRGIGFVEALIYPCTCISFHFQKLIFFWLIIYMSFILIGLLY